MAPCLYPELSRCKIFRGSSVVEQLTVNQLAVGSSPTRGANPFSTNLDSEVFS